LLDSLPIELGHEVILLSSQAEAGHIKRVNSDADLIRPRIPLQQIQIHALEDLLLRQPCLSMVDIYIIRKRKRRRIGFVGGADGVRVIHRLKTFCPVHVTQDELVLL
jgi:hypothetical protein